MRATRECVGTDSRCGLWIFARPEHTTHVIVRQDVETLSIGTARGARMYTNPQAGIA